MARVMTLRRFLLWLLALLVVLIVAGGWYARVAWQEWQQLNNIRNLQWQGVNVSLSGVQLEHFAITQLRDGQSYRVEGEALSLGWKWNWYGPTPDVVLVGRLAVDVPAWPNASQQTGASTEVSGGLPRQLPAWLPDNIAIEQLALTLPKGIHATGDLTLSELAAPDDRSIATKALRIDMPVPAMTRAGWRIHKGRASLVIAGKAEGQSADFEFRDGSFVEVARVEAPDSALRLDRLRVKLAGMELTAGYSLQPMALEELAFEGTAVATAATIQQSQLHPQPWRLDGRLEGSLKGLTFDGRLSSDAGAVANIRSSLPFDGIAQLDADMTAVGTKGSRQLSGTFTAWPEGLEVEEGSIRTELGLRFPPEGARMQGQVTFDGLGGLFVRTAWAGLNGKVAIEKAGDRLEAGSSRLSLDTVNPGIALSNVEIVGGYRSTMEQMGAGTLTIEQASAQLLGGSVRVEPAQWQLSDLPLRVPLELSGIELSELMQVYPAEGLAGSGVLRGKVPLWISEEGVSIESGQVEAVAPGGTLKLPADRLRGMAQKNEAMALVVQAMQNFNYTVLNSTVDYDQDGTLVLGLRLEGSSPDVRDGHPIVLNINLEEDIPALLTSLQLSGRVNEAVTEKVRNLIRKRDAGSQSTGSGN
ncbi:YdbH domain-containing protein [Marinobacter sp. TBZ242]|uniref:YdbH domain-containing protein n=1 Tax=Marinobacter azerbaijanicus TaxID=3050455 RepID=A0ABT7I8E2_9GAMM|nr:YdbH domain-containing protein [Marinobacter sp. TBZ242]MDL0430432.1 YdbH domain-containing protein [Marinobacter sp. TBZ242]